MLPYKSYLIRLTYYMVVCDNIAMEITVGVYLCRRFDADKCAEFGEQFSEGQSCPLYSGGAK